MNYTLYADESGQSGIKKVKSSTTGGASRYMTMGGALVPDENREHIREALAGLAESFGRADLHCSKLNHNQIVKFAQTVAEFDVVLFGVISLKETLGSYKDDIEANDKKYYNKCAQYLLERVGMFLDSVRLNEDNLSVRFEYGGFNYNGLRGLIQACRRNPRYPATRFLRHVNQNSITEVAKSDEPLLQLGDLTAHALFRCVDDGPSSYGVFETRYLSELRSRFFAARNTGMICGAGLFPVHTIADIQADKQVRQFLTDFRSRE